MTQTIVTNMKRAVCGGLAAAALIAGAPAQAQEVVILPPDVIATTTPVYYNGVPAYWYGGRWYYRNGPGWGYYHDEPPFLRDWRGRQAPERRYYEGHPHYDNHARGGWHR